MDKIGPEKIEIEIDYVECKYCHITTFLINEYGKCPNGCPGHFSVLNSRVLKIPKDCIIAQSITTDMTDTEEF